MKPSLLYSHGSGGSRASILIRLLIAGLLLNSLLVGFCQENRAVPAEYPLMHFTREQRLGLMQAHRAAPQYSVANGLQAGFPDSLSLLSHLPYVPDERDQGGCGDCWQWAGTGVMEIAHDVQNGIHDRLSVQLLNSCNTLVSCCAGGWLTDVSTFYSSEGFAIPWTNNDAQFSSGYGSCDSAPCGSIAKTPQYPITNITTVSITTYGVGQAQAIANIKSVLSQNQAVWFAFFLPTSDDWSQFFDFWNNQPETAVWTNFFCGQTADSGFEGHAVLCVGYDDSNATNRYWIMVNSWGTAGGGRPNDIFLVSMDLDYDCADSEGGQTLYWETLDVQFGPTTPTAPSITSQPQNQTVQMGQSATFTVTASGNPVPGYQWQRKAASSSKWKNLITGTNYAGTTSGALTVMETTMAMSGDQFRCVVTNGVKPDATSAAATLTVNLPPPPPANDDFANATSISGTTAQLTGSNAYATREPGEPNHAGDAGGHSVWWKWMAPAGGAATLNTIGSDFDTLLAVYTGNSVSNLSQVAANNDSGGSLTSAVIFNPLSGTNYWIAVDGYEGATGAIVLNLSVSPLAAWGDDSSGQTDVPPGLVNVVAVAGGLYHSLALRGEGTIAAWGVNVFGQNGVPMGLSDVVAIGDGFYHSVALRANGQVVAWGSDSLGQTSVPTDLTNAVAIAVGSQHNLALKSDGTVVAWGNPVATQVPAQLSNVVAIAAGESDSLALRADGTVVAWGDDSYGQTNVPTDLTNAIAIAAGRVFNLALRSDGTVVAWGTGFSGETVVPADLTNVVAIAAGGEHSLALKNDGTVAAWGRNIGSSGGFAGQAVVPAGLSNVVAIAGGAYHSLAIVDTPTLRPTLFNPTRQGATFNAVLATLNRKSYALDTQELAERDHLDKVTRCCGKRWAKDSDRSCRHGSGARLSGCATIIFTHGRQRY